MPIKFPRAIGGVRRDNARIATPLCTVRLFLDRMAGVDLVPRSRYSPNNLLVGPFLGKGIINRSGINPLVSILRTTGEIVYDGDANDEG